MGISFIVPFTVGTDAANKFESVHDRHDDIGDDEFRLLIFDLLQSLLTIVGRIDYKIPGLRTILF